MDVMNGRSHQWGRGNRILRWLRFPTVITLPGGRPRERYAYLFWRVRLPLWIVPAVIGWLLLSWPGIAAGLAAGILAEMVFSYRAPYGLSRPVAAGHGGGSDGFAGVREPRRPHPTGSYGGARLPADPARPVMD
jgi:hypothetical protein